MSIDVAARNSGSRRGLTLVEVIVALMLVAIGMLGLAGTSSLLMRATVARAAERRAAHHASWRIVQLAAAGCAAARDGKSADATTGLREEWHLSAASGGAVSVAESIQWPSGGTTRRLTVRSAFLC